MDGPEFVGVDERGQLYWNGERVEFAPTLTLTRAENFIAVAGVLTEIAVAVVEWLRFFGFGEA